jgi:hypothetical protein
VKYGKSDNANRELEESATARIYSDRTLDSAFGLRRNCSLDLDPNRFVQPYVPPWLGKTIAW